MCAALLLHLSTTFTLVCLVPEGFTTLVLLVPFLAGAAAPVFLNRAWICILFGCLQKDQPRRFLRVRSAFLQAQLRFYFGGRVPVQIPGVRHTR